MILQNRLRMVDAVEEGARRPARAVEAPIVVTGLGRSGTTLLHELLACDPDNRPPLLWELLHTVPYDDASGDVCDDEIKLMDEIVPAFTAMHENGGRLPTECIFAFAHQFSSDVFTGLYNVAEYTVWRSGVDQAPIYDWHKRHLQTLQWVAERPTARWVVKAPSHLSALPLGVRHVPDARVVITHRDPLRVIGSLSDLMATLHCMHSDHVDHAVLVEFMAMGLELQMDHVTAERDAGAVPNDQIADVVYKRPDGRPARRRGAALCLAGACPSPTRSAPRSTPTWRPATPAAPAGTTTPSPTRGSTWRPTVRWSRRTRSAFGVPLRGLRLGPSERACADDRTMEGQMDWRTRDTSWCRWPTSTGRRPSTRMRWASTSTSTTAPARTSGWSS